MGPFFLGIDGGGTSCRARLADSAGTVLGEGLSGSANLTLGIDTAAHALRAATDAALIAAGLPEQCKRNIHAGFGLAGANVPSLAAELQSVSFGFATLNLASDAVIACLGAHGGADGAILILGTGSQGLAMIDGQVHTIGGWGFSVSDEGSGAILGRAALRAALRAHEGFGPASPLTTDILAQFDHDPAKMVLWAQSATPRDYGHFAPHLFTHHHKNDAVAHALLSDSVTQITAMIERLRALGATRIALMGGLAAPCTPLLPAHVHPWLTQPQGDAMDGALQLAHQGKKP
eukprot:gene17522-17722_t